MANVDEQKKKNWLEYGQPQRSKSGAFNEDFLCITFVSITFSHNLCFNQVFHERSRKISLENGGPLHLSTPDIYSEHIMTNNENLSCYWMCGNGREMVIIVMGRDKMAY